MDSFSEDSFEDSLLELLSVADNFFFEEEEEEWWWWAADLSSLVTFIVQYFTFPLSISSIGFFRVSRSVKASLFSFPLFSRTTVGPIHTGESV